MIARLEMLPIRPAFFSGRTAIHSVPTRTRQALFRSREDVEDSLAFVRSELLEISRRDRERWDFDFSRERPVTGGRYVWEPVGTTQRPNTERPESELRPTAERQQPTTSDTSPNPTAKLNQTKISDFWSKRKRRPSSPANKTTGSVSSDDSSSRPVKVQRTASS